jgi:uroporphyrinogen decarboxylase
MDEMNSRERVLAAINHQPVDRVPTDIWAVAEVREKLTARHGSWESVREQLHIDGIAHPWPDYVGPALPAVGADEKVNYFGMRHKAMRYATGVYWEQSFAPLAGAKTIDDLEKYQWPSADWFDYSKLREQAVELRKSQALMLGYMAPFTYHLYLRGLENALMDPLAEPEFTRHFLARLCDFFYEQHLRILQACEGLADLVQVTDDYGMQTGPIMGLATFREFYKPHLARFCKLGRQFGCKVFHHDDGAIRPFIPDMIEIGVSVLNPIQWPCPGMEQEGLKRDFGGRLCFHGGIDNQRILPFGTEAEVRTEVRHNIDALASDRTGYILAPCHNIQANTPIENILAMYDEAHRYGKF